jgi:hypothetical protein
VANLTIVIILAVFGFSSQAFAQGAEGGAAAGSYQFEAHVVGGAIVTNTHGVDATVTVVGVRGAYTPSWGAIELGFQSGRGQQNVIYRSIPLNYRIDVPMEGIRPFALVGGRVDLYQTNDPDGNREMMGNGWQIGGGLMLDLVDAVALRGDFELRFGPGRSLFSGVSAVVRF